VAAGARFFLVAYNIDLDTEDLDAVNEVAFAVRELGTPVLGPDGEAVLDERGRKRMRPGKLRFTKGIGVPIPERKMCQVSMNLTHYLITPPHVAFEEVRLEAERRGIAVTGSEVVGLIPLEPLLMAAEYGLFARGARDAWPGPLTQDALVAVAHDYLGLSDFTPFDPQTKIIEYAIR
jgi:glutamate formiminotransferase/formiminotetrahydrofolate cyclodeaminase